MSWLTIDKKISIMDIVSLLAAAVAILWNYSAQDKRIAILEAERTAQHAVDQRQDGDLKQLVADMKIELQRVNDKLDRVIEARR